MTPTLFYVTTAQGVTLGRFVARADAEAFAAHHPFGRLPAGVYVTDRFGVRLSGVTRGERWGEWVHPAGQTA